MTSFDKFYKYIAAKIKKYLTNTKFFLNFAPNFIHFTK